MELNKIINPINIFGAITILSYLVTEKFNLFNYVENINYVKSYILLPYIIYIIIMLYLFIVNKCLIKKTIESPQLHKNTKSITIFLLKLYLVICIYIFLDYIIKFGGITGFINAIFKGNSAYELQVNLSGILTVGYQLNVILPIIIMFLLNYNISKKERNLIIISIIINAIYSFMIAARVLFVINILTIIIYKNYNFKINIKKIITFTLCGFCIYQLMIYGQMRNVGTKDREIGREVLVNYYENSIENAITIIDGKKVKYEINGPYWTFRPLLNIPVITKLFNIPESYEKYIGDIPIKERMDDFVYAQSLGVDPRYNTFSIYGYSYLDYGFYGFIFITIYFLIVSFFYKRSKNNCIYRMIYVLFIVTSFDIMRTNGIFTGTIIVRLLFLVLILLINRINIRFIKNKKEIIKE